MSPSKIVIVDYGAGNLNSVKKAFDHLGANALLATQPEVIAQADKIVSPELGTSAPWPRSTTRACGKRCCRPRAPANRF